MERAPEDPQARSEKCIILWIAIGFGLLIGLVGGGGIVFHDGKSWTEGLLGGLGLFALGFALMYFRYARRIAELLSLIR